MIQKNLRFRYSLVLFTLLTCISSGLMAGTLALGEKGKNKKEEKKELLTADGPYILYQPEGGARVITVNECGVLLDTTYATLPEDFSFRVSDHKGRYPFTVKLHPSKRQSWQWQQADKVFVMSDPHGKMDCVVSLLQGNHVIDRDLHWSFGNNQLMVIGDIFDRGKDVTQIFWFFYKLEAEAVAAGGKVSFLLGNHEPMVLAGDMRYSKGKYQALADTLGMSYPYLWSENTELGRWLATRNTMQVIGKDLYVHAGLSKNFYEHNLDINTVNETMSKALFMDKKKRSALSPLTDFLYGSYGPIWYRGLVRDKEKYHPLSADTLQLLLNRYQVDRIIVGHTIFDDITKFYKGKVIGVNVDNEKNRKHKRGRALLIEPRGCFIVGDKGKMRKL